MRNQLLENDITPSRRERFLSEGIFGIQCHDIPSDGISTVILFYFLNHFIIPTGLLSFFAHFWGLWKVWSFFVFVALVSALTLTLLLV